MSGTTTYYISSWLYKFVGVKSSVHRNVCGRHANIRKEGNNLKYIYVTLNINILS